MLDLISKFIFRRPTTDKQSVPSANAGAAVQLAEAKKSQVSNERVLTLEKIDSLGNDEAAAIALLLACDFADGRIKAAQHVQSQAGLEQVKAAMLNVDKRVVKLMQTRLDAITLIVQQEQLAQLCLDEANHLAQQAQLMSNQVIALDKRRAAVTLFPAQLSTEFEQIRAQIEIKMLAQTALQRRVLDVVNQVKDIAQVTDSGEEAEASIEIAMAHLDQLQHELDRCQNQAESASLPKNMLTDWWCTNQ